MGGWGQYVSALACALWVAMAVPGPASARPATLVPRQGEGSIQGWIHRALIWRRADALELIVEPVIASRKGTTWVMPLPARPEWARADRKIFVDMDQVTAPIFYSVWLDFSCDGDDSSLSPGEPALAADLSDTRLKWDATLLCAADGDDLASWADEHGFGLSKEARAVLSEVETPHGCTFVAQARGAHDGIQALAPVRFRLPPTTTPSLPLRLAGALASPGELLDLSVWIVDDADRGYGPSGRTLARRSALGTTPTSPHEYGAAVAAWLSANVGAFLIQYASSLAPDEWFVSQYDCWEPAYRSFAHDTPDLKVMMEEACHATRMRALLARGNLTSDVVFVSLATHTSAFPPDDGAFCAVDGESDYEDCGWWDNDEGATGGSGPWTSVGPCMAGPFARPVGHSPGLIVVYAALLGALRLAAGRAHRHANGRRASDAG